MTREDQGVCNHDVLPSPGHKNNDLCDVARCQRLTASAATVSFVLINEGWIAYA